MKNSISKTGPIARVLALALAGLLCGQAGTRAADSALPFKNAGMEEGTNSPTAWNQGRPVPGVQLNWDRTTAHGGKASLCLKKTVQRYFPIAEWNQTLAVEPAGKARKLRVRCWVKAENVTKAIIDVNWPAPSAGHAWAVYLGQKQQTDPVATHDWKQYEGTVDVPAQVAALGIVFQIYGPGTVWFDDLEVGWVQ